MFVVGLRPFPLMVFFGSIFSLSVQHLCEGSRVSSGSRKLSFMVWSVFFKIKVVESPFFERFKFGFCSDFGSMRFEAVVIEGGSQVLRLGSRGAGSRVSAWQCQVVCA